VLWVPVSFCNFQNHKNSFLKKKNKKKSIYYELFFFLKKEFLITLI
jgi:hypothetical protein